jgi:Predicted metal-dependent hydrolase of the TIM-barrel fold
MRRLILATMVMSLTASGLWAQVDVHSHAVTASYLEFVKAHGAEMDEGFPIPGWNVEEHLDFMDRAGIETSVLTMPAPQPWFGDGAESAAFCRKYNEECAALKARYPGRFLFCASLPLPDVDRAVEEAVYALDVLGADGVKLASNSYGQYLGDPELEPLMAVLNERQAVIITHPHKPSAVNDKLVAEVPLASYEYLAETTRAVLNMVAHDVLVRYPDLKVVVPHCGSFLPNALPRFKGLLPVMVGQGYMQQVDVDANVSRLYFDLAGAATDDAVRSLLTITSADHLLYGSDYPYVAAPALVSAKEFLARRLPAMGLDPQAVLADNARRLFGADIPVREYGERLVRLAEIEVVPEKLASYLEYASEVGRVSMAVEPGVIALFSIQDKSDPCKVYILEVYADTEAYQAHIRTAHFRKYKEGTADMVRSLKLIDTDPLVMAEFVKKAQ